MAEKNELMIPEEVILRKIYLIRDQKVMLDMDLAELYGVETKQLKRAVRRNISRFPLDFMFELTSEELSKWRRQFGTSNREKMGLRIPPFAFTEHGVLMLASVLNSDRAIIVNIQVVRVFARMRQLIETHAEILRKLEQLQKKDLEQDQQILLIFEYLKQLEQVKQQELEFKGRKRIGYKRNNE
jgi:hypothetical protein